MELLNYLEMHHRTAARVIYNLHRDMPAAEVYWYSKLNTLTYQCKLRLIKLFHSVFKGEAPAALSYLTNTPCMAFNTATTSLSLVLTRTFLKSQLAIAEQFHGTLF